MEQETQAPLLTELDNYLQAGIHIGAKFKTKYMNKFIYRVRGDGLVIMNINKIDERLKVVAKFLSCYEPNEIIINCRRENGFEVLQLLNSITGITVMPGRYKPGIFTNPKLENFMEPKLMVVIDPIVDKNAVLDAIRLGIPVVALCDSNNESNFIDLVMPCNNKGRKSIGLVFWILAKEYLKAKGKIKDDSELIKYFDEFVKEE